MVESYHLPTATNKLPAPLKTEFTDAAEKGAFITEVVNVSTKAMQEADEKYRQFLYKEAHAEYIVSLDGFMYLMKQTQDDANFQAFCKTKLTYLLDKVSSSSIF